MQPDLSPHLHTAECNVLIKIYKDCLANYKFGKFIGYCNYWDEAVWQCTKKERILRRSSNPKYGKRLVEIRRLPEEYYTEPLRQLKREGKLNFDDAKGCKI